MFKKVLVGLSMCSVVLLANISLEHKVGQMLMVGFHGISAKPESQICKDIKKYDLGAVILFDFNPVDKTKPKNIANKAQMTRLTKELQACSPKHNLLIAVDQEGGRVQRLKSQYGFYGKFPKAANVVKFGMPKMRQTYEKMARELKSVGINYNLAPVVDLDINQKNHVIHGLGRSFGKDPQMVTKYASLFMDAMHHYGVLTSLKHFPGHGSSVGDTHKGFVDVTNLWRSIELEPYRLLSHQADTVMVAHVFNKKLDIKYPATLSRKTVEGLLRKKLDFNGVVITDDLQMGAISKTYGLKTTLQLAINAGDDMLLFGNQIDPKKVVSIQRLVELVIQLVKEGKVSKKRINQSYRRIRILKKRIR
ncbi:MAG: glycosyl hydrolase [Sulfurovum sp.]|nr:glycosyl hydrolase [Sulfurovum sp.]MCB4745790.1 glycosyl hydrolase [Sulfurovum sp.]MCB4747863.1 glycosyl hydrolase [Sulfurovum sp.]MCB4748624.1 glycosyl hydrolase [Sulfurovum sp.]MCB4750818.1 glycosyl hydrolase [Sulfurovum sp.]